MRREDTGGSQRIIALETSFRMVGQSASSGNGSIAHGARCEHLGDLMP